MNWQAISYDWNQARAFLATVEEGSLSAAARALDLTQPTLSRQVSALEDALEITLFIRGHREMVLTSGGLEILEHVRAMRDAATRVSLSAGGQSEAVEGRVSISASDVMSALILPPILKELRAIAPGITIDIIASNAVSDLTRRESDIAIRHLRPTQPELIAKKVLESSGHLFATAHYIETLGEPHTPADLANADFIGFESVAQMLPLFIGLGLPLTAQNFRHLSPNGMVVLALVRQDLGIAMMPREIAALFPELVMVLPELQPILVDTWLVAHRELHTSQRIRVVFDHLSKALTSQASNSRSTS